MKSNRTIVFLLIFLPTVVYANSQCWEVGNLKGQEAKEGWDYKFKPSAISKKTFQIRIGEGSASVTPNDLSCTPLTPASLVCMYKEESASTVETWAVEGSQVLYTKSITGRGVFNGVTAFVGSVVGRCH